VSWYPGHGSDMPSGRNTRLFLLHPGALPHGHSAAADLLINTLDHITCRGKGLRRDLQQAFS
jgi:hypothetical protein